MTPDRPEGRERLASIEAQVRANERQIEMLGALPLQVGVMTERLDSLREDIRERERDIDARFERHERSTSEALERLARSFENQLLTCSSQIGDLAERFQKYTEAEEKRREGASSASRDDERQSKTARYAMWGLIGAAAVTGILTFATTLVQALTS